MRYLVLLFVLIFLSFAYLQLNDPDPLWWCALYLVPAYVCFMAYLKKYNTELLSILIILYLSYAVNSWLQMTKWEGFFTEGSGMEMKSLNQELAREALGLLICVFVYLGLFVYSCFNKKSLA